jgi:hypothetical protein
LETTEIRSNPCPESERRARWSTFSPKSRFCHTLAFKKLENVEQPVRVGVRVGEWRMESGEWRMESGEWRMEEIGVGVGEGEGVGVGIGEGMGEEVENVRGVVGSVGGGAVAQTFSVAGLRSGHGADAAVGALGALGALGVVRAVGAVGAD